MSGTRINSRARLITDNGLKPSQIAWGEEKWGHLFQKIPAAQLAVRIEEERAADKAAIKKLKKQGYVPIRQLTHVKKGNR